METIKIVYMIQYYHVLTFSNEYRKKMARFFSMPNLRYGIDEQGTLNETIRLIFNNEKVGFRINKETAMMTFSGSLDKFKAEKGMLDTFFDVFKAVSSIDGFQGVISHELHSYSVLLDKEIVEFESIDKSQLIKPSISGKLEDFAIILDVLNDTMKVSANIGNYRPKDITTFDLLPFDPVNEDMQTKTGYLIELKIKQSVTDLDRNNMRKLLSTTKSYLKEILEWL